jgi:cell division protein FtsN
MRITAVIAVLLALLVPSAALAQQNNNNQNQAQPTQPFQPLPPAQPTPAPTAEPEDDGGFLDQEISGSATLYLIAAALLVAFIFIGMFISRDAKRALPKAHRADSRRLREEGPHKHKRDTKAKSRARGKAQKAARRRNR